MRYLNLLLISLVLVLFGCSLPEIGSDDKDKPDEKPVEQPKKEPEVERISLTGLAVKGRVRNTLVEVFKLEEGAFSSTPLAKGKTDAQGRYELSVATDKAYSGPALVKISWQQGAEILCDAQNCRDSAGQQVTFGKYYNLPEDFSMLAIVPYVVSSPQTAAFAKGNVTSLTHIAAEYVKGQTTVNRSIANAGNTRVRLLFGLSDKVDLLSTTPADVTAGTSGAEETLYGLMTAAIADIAKKNNEDVADTLTKFASEFKANGGQLLWNNKDTGRVGEISVLDVIAAAQAVAIEVGNSGGTIPSGATTGLSGYSTDLAAKDNGISNINPAIISISDDKAVNAGETVQLSVKVDNFTAAQVTFKWQQLAGAVVTLTGATSADVSFVAPAEGGIIELGAEVKVTASNQVTMEKVRILVKSAAGNATNVEGTYHFMENSIELATSHVPNQQFVGIFQNTEYSSEIKLKALTEDKVEIELVGQQDRIKADVDYRPDNNANDSSTGFDYKRAHIMDNLPGESQSETNKFEGTVDSLNRVIFDLPQEGKARDQEYELELRQQFAFDQLSPDVFLTSRVTRSLRYALTADNQPDLNALKSKTFRAGNMLIVRKGSNMSAADITDEYGVVHLTSAFDEARIMDVVSGIERWDFEDANTLATKFTVHEDSIETGADKSKRYINTVNIASGSYTTLDPAQTSSNQFSITAGEGAPFFSNLGSAGFLIDPAGHLSLPATTVDGATGIFKGLISPDEKFLHGQLVAKKLRGTIDGANIGQVGKSQYWGVRISSATPDIASKKYQIQGISQLLHGSSGSFELERTHGQLEFNAQGEPAFSANLVLEGISTRTYTSQTETENFNSSNVGENAWNAVLAANGRISLTSELDSMEGYVSDDNQIILLRFYSEEDYLQGILIGRLIQ